MGIVIGILTIYVNNGRGNILTLYPTRNHFVTRPIYLLQNSLPETGKLPSLVTRRVHVPFLFPTHSDLMLYLYRGGLHINNTIITLVNKGRLTTLNFLQILTMIGAIFRQLNGDFPLASVVNGRTHYNHVLASFPRVGANNKVVHHLPLLSGISENRRLIVGSYGTCFAPCEQSDDRSPVTKDPGKRAEGTDAETTVRPMYDPTGGTRPTDEAGAMRTEPRRTPTVRTEGRDATAVDVDTEAGKTTVVFGVIHVIRASCGGLVFTSVYVLWLHEEKAAEVAPTTPASKRDIRGPKRPKDIALPNGNWDSAATSDFLDESSDNPREIS